MVTWIPVYQDIPPFVSEIMTEEASVVFDTKLPAWI